jgi:hypothetical protein
MDSTIGRAIERDGAHAAVDDLTLLTRDARRYRNYFPTVRLLAPET